ncbi:3492_t:CDS:2, partial [Entrophospora sp. SA101]
LSQFPGYSAIGLIVIYEMGLSVISFQSSAYNKHVTHACLTPLIKQQELEIDLRNDKFPTCKNDDINDAVIPTLKKTSGNQATDSSYDDNDQTSGFDLEEESSFTPLELEENLLSDFIDNIDKIIKLHYPNKTTLNTKTNLITQLTDNTDLCSMAEK